MNDIEVTKFYVRHREGYPETEMQDYARRGFWTLNVETVPFEWIDDIKEKMDDLGPTVGIAGYIGDVWAGLKRLGKLIPEPLDYPTVLHEFLGRAVWRSLLEEVRRTIDPVFVKPVEHKAFTGFVWNADRESRMRIVTHGDDLPVWLSDPVEFVSEWRACILYRKIIGVRQYRGDWWRVPDREVVEAAVYKMGRKAPHAYCLDWGVTSDGQTLLVEANEGYAFGHYGLHPVSYARMLAARWYELASQPTLQVIENQ